MSEAVFNFLPLNQAICVITRWADTGRVPPARGVMVSAAALPAGLRTVSTELTAVLTVVAVAITCASYKRILSAQKITSFADFGEAPFT